MPKRTTQADVAKAAGVSQVTVSLALRNNPRISEKVRDQIRKIAREMGYCPDPMLSSLVAYRQSNKPLHYRGTLAWLTNFDTADGWKSVTHNLMYMKGARKRAEELGFNLDEFWVREPRLTSRRLTNILVSRNISGLIICPQQHANAEISLTWSRFSTVKIGYSLQKPDIHMVTNCHFRSMCKVYDQLKALGYGRIGTVLLSDHDVRVGNNYLAGYLLKNNQQQSRNRLPELLIETSEKAEFLNWFKKNRPEAIISFSYLPLKEWLKDIDMKVPGDVGIACPSLQEEHPEYAGIDEQPEHIGAAAVDVAVAMIHRNEKGIPSNPRLILLDGIWKKGKTVRKQK